MYMPLWHQLMNQKPLFSISENYSQHCQTTLSWSKYYSLMSIGVNRSALQVDQFLIGQNKKEKNLLSTVVPSGMTFAHVLKKIPDSVLELKLHIIMFSQLNSRNLFESILTLRMRLKIKPY